MQQIPQQLQGILWSKSLDKLDLQADRAYIIHQLLSFGDMKAIAWLLKTYRRETVAQVFIESPKRLYDKATFYFIKDIVLGLPDQPLSESAYVKISPANLIRPAERNITQAG